ncbi:MAG: C69 family dipeptidase [Galactobacter sp.]
MGCTTILVGKDASYDGSPLVARNEDSSAGNFDPKKVIVVKPEDQPTTYTSVLSHVSLELPENPLRYTAIPNALPDEGIWGCAGINAANVAMSATETLTSNPRVLGADPLVSFRAEVGEPGTDSHVPEHVGGLGEEDFVSVVLPYIHSAREGVLRLGALLAEHGTYEMNGIAFSDAHEIWWLETVGGHHWIAKRVPDDHYVTMPNQLGIDSFDLNDALGEGREHLCSRDLADFIADHHLALDLAPAEAGDDAVGHKVFNPRLAFGSHSDSDHVYNTPRAWYMQRTLNPHAEAWDSEDGLRPSADDIPWSRRPERKLSIEDVKDVLSSHFQGTVYDPYSSRGTDSERSRFRPIGINRHNVLAILQVRPYIPEEYRSLQWIAYASNPFNTLVPMYTNVGSVPDYLGSTGAKVSTDSLYWSSRIIAALADAHFNEIIPTIERYQQATLATGHRAVLEADAEAADVAASAVVQVLEAANEAQAERVRAATDDLLGTVLHLASNYMRNGFRRSDN